MAPRKFGGYPEVPGRVEEQPVRAYETRVIGEGRDRAGHVARLHLDLADLAGPGVPRVRIASGIERHAIADVGAYRHGRVAGLLRVALHEYHRLSALRTDVVHRIGGAARHPQVTVGVKGNAVGTDRPGGKHLRVLRRLEVGRAEPRRVDAIDDAALWCRCVQVAVLVHRDTENRRLRLGGELPDALRGTRGRIHPIDAAVLPVDRVELAAELAEPLDGRCAVTDGGEDPEAGRGRGRRGSRRCSGWCRCWTLTLAPDGGGKKEQGGEGQSGHEVLLLNEVDRGCLQS